MEQPGGAGAAGTASELAVGFAIAQQMMAQQGLPTKPVAGGAAGAAAAGTAAAPAAAMPDLMSPAEAAQVLGVSEADVMSVIESGDLKAKKIGSAYRIRRAAIEEYLAKE
jgi:excisionase family DNA binding protein